MTPDNQRMVLHAYIDGELDAVSTIELEEEIAASPELQQELSRITALRDALRGATHFSVPAGLLERAFFSASASPKTPRREVASWWRAAAIGSSALAAAQLLWILGAPWMPSVRRGGAVEDVVSAHIRSLMADHLTDLASSERHTVKPWLSSRLDFAPPVRDLSAQGYQLIGARLEYINGEAVAAIVYQQRRHVINVFVQPARESSSSRMLQGTGRGYNTIQFHADGMSYWLVSDVNSTDLQQLAGLLLSQ